MKQILSKMKIKDIRVIILLMPLVLIFILTGCGKKEQVAIAVRQSLTDNWKMQPSIKLEGVPAEKGLSLDHARILVPRHPCANLERVLPVV